MTGRSPLLAALATTTLAGIILAALGPFGTYLNGPFLSRLGYWLATCWLGLGLYGGMVLVLFARSGPRSLSGWADFSAVLALALLASLPEAWLSHMLALWMWPMLNLHPPSLTLWYGQTALIGAVWTFVLANTLLVRAGRVPTAPENTTPERGGPIADNMLFSGDILALQMDDHYVRIHSKDGSRMVLMPLGQAIASLPNVEGLRTHRSWWVARAAVAQVQGTPRAMRLILKNGIEAPVARAAVAHLRQAGWIDT